jgi:hypothetical protein
MATIDCFIPCNHAADAEKALKQFMACPLVNRVHLLSDTVFDVGNRGTVMVVDSLTDTKLIQSIAAAATSEFVMVVTRNTAIELGQFALDRMVRIARDTGASMVYSDYFKVEGEARTAYPVNDYQAGSLRDDFNFGSVWVINTILLKKAVEMLTADYKFAGWYDLRLALSRLGELVHINELLYSEVDTDSRKSGEKQFDYVDPRNRAVQVEMEQVCTEHLKAIGGWLAPVFEEVNTAAGEFPVEASVIIPVRNRVKTISDAIQSVLRQQTGFQFNLIIIDNFSTDGTTELIARAAAADARILHLIPERTDLGIGGCWNEGVFHPACGKFAVQLDSDDVYSNEFTLQKMVDAFYEQQCAMVVGSYTMTDFSMNEIPPGLIDHKEWTPDNGRNNALRINGLGAPRAFFTPVLRSVKVPNTSYGEDYALGLAISRHYRIGRVYESVYLCRRWDDNSDASLDVVKLNAHNAYKDKIRTIELKARINMNKLQ